MESFFEPAAEPSTSGRSARAAAGTDYTPFMDDELRALDEELRALDDEQRAPTPHPVHSRSPTPSDIEYDEDGRITSRSKGKGRAD
jgi:hypothetical protein